MAKNTWPFAGFWNCVPFGSTLVARTVTVASPTLIGWFRPTFRFEPGSAAGAAGVATGVGASVAVSVVAAGAVVATTGAVLAAGGVEMLAALVASVPLEPPAAAPMAPMTTTAATPPRMSFLRTMDSLPLDERMSPDIPERRSVRWFNRRVGGRL